MMSSDFESEPKNKGHEFEHISPTFNPNLQHENFWFKKNRSGNQQLYTTKDGHYSNLDAALKGVENTAGLSLFELADEKITERDFWILKGSAKSSLYFKGEIARQKDSLFHELTFELGAEKVGKISLLDFNEVLPNSGNINIAVDLCSFAALSKASLEIGKKTSFDAGIEVGVMGPSVSLQHQTGAIKLCNFVVIDVNTNIGIGVGIKGAASLGADIDFAKGNISGHVKVGGFVGWGVSSDILYDLSLAPEAKQELSRIQTMNSENYKSLCKQDPLATSIIQEFKQGGFPGEWADEHLDQLSDMAAIKTLVDYLTEKSPEPKVSDLHYYGNEVTPDLVGQLAYQHAWQLPKEEKEKFAADSKALVETHIKGEEVAPIRKASASNLLAEEHTVQAVFSVSSQLTNNLNNSPSSELALLSSNREQALQVLDVNSLSLDGFQPQKNLQVDTQTSNREQALQVPDVSSLSLDGFQPQKNLQVDSQTSISLQQTIGDSVDSQKVFSSPEQASYKPLLPTTELERHSADFAPIGLDIDRKLATKPKTKINFKLFDADGPSDPLLSYEYKQREENYSKKSDVDLEVSIGLLGVGATGVCLQPSIAVSITFGSSLLLNATVIGSVAVFAGFVGYKLFEGIRRDWHKSKGAEKALENLASKIGRLDDANHKRWNLDNFWMSTKKDRERTTNHMKGAFSTMLDNNSDPDLRFCMQAGLSMVNEGREKEFMQGWAKKDYTQSNEAYENLLNGLYSSVSHDLKQGNASRALPGATKLAKHAPDDPAAMLLLTNVYLRMDDVGLARGTIDEYVKRHDEGMGYEKREILYTAKLACHWFDATKDPAKIDILREYALKEYQECPFGGGNKTGFFDSFLYDFEANKYLNLDQALIDNLNKAMLKADLPVYHKELYAIAHYNENHVGQAQETIRDLSQYERTKLTWSLEGVLLYKEFRETNDQVSLALLKGDKEAEAQYQHQSELKINDIVTTLKHLSSQELNEDYQVRLMLYEAKLNSSDINVQNEAKFAMKKEFEKFSEKTISEKTLEESDFKVAESVTSLLVNESLKTNNFTEAGNHYAVLSSLASNDRAITSRISRSKNLLQFQKIIFLKQEEQQAIKYNNNDLAELKAAETREAIVAFNQAYEELTFDSKNDPQQLAAFGRIKLFEGEIQLARKAFNSISGNVLNKIAKLDGLADCELEEMRGDHQSKKHLRNAISYKEEALTESLKYNEADKEKSLQLFSALLSEREGLSDLYEHLADRSKGKSAEKLRESALEQISNKIVETNESDSRLIGKKASLLCKKGEFDKSMLFLEERSGKLKDTHPDLSDQSLKQSKDVQNYLDKELGVFGAQVGVILISQVAQHVLSDTADQYSVNLKRVAKGWIVANAMVGDVAFQTIHAKLAGQLYHDLGTQGNESSYYDLIKGQVTQKLFLAEKLLQVGGLVRLCQGTEGEGLVKKTILDVMEFGSGSLSTAKTFIPNLSDYGNETFEGFQNPFNDVMFDVGLLMGAFNSYMNSRKINGLLIHENPAMLGLHDLTTYGAPLLTIATVAKHIPAVKYYFAAAKTATLAIVSPPVLIAGGLVLVGCGLYLAKPYYDEISLDMMKHNISVLLRGQSYVKLQDERRQLIRQQNDFIDSNVAERIKSIDKTIQSQRSSNLNKAYIKAREYLMLRPDDPEVKKSFSIILRERALEDKKYDEVIAICTDEIRKLEVIKDEIVQKDDLIELKKSRGKAHLAMKNFVLAERDFIEFSDDPHALTNLAQIANQRGNTASAHKLFEKSIDLLIKQIDNYADVESDNDTKRWKIAGLVKVLYNFMNQHPNVASVIKLNKKTFDPTEKYYQSKRAKEEGELELAEIKEALSQLNQSIADMWQGLAGEIASNATTAILSLFVENMSSYLRMSESDCLSGMPLIEVPEAKISPDNLFDKPMTKAEVASYTLTPSLWGSVSLTPDIDVDKDAMQLGNSL